MIKHTAEIKAINKTSNKARTRYVAEYVKSAFDLAMGTDLLFDGKRYTVHEPAFFRKKEPVRIDHPMGMLDSEWKPRSGGNVVTLKEIFVAALPTDDPEYTPRLDTLNKEYVALLKEPPELELIPSGMTCVAAMEWLNKEHQEWFYAKRGIKGPDAEPCTIFQHFMGVTQAGLLRVRSYLCADKLQDPGEPFEDYQWAIHNGGGVGSAPMFGMPKLLAMTVLTYAPPPPALLPCTSTPCTTHAH